MLVIGFAAAFTTFAAGCESKVKNVAPAPTAGHSQQPTSSVDAESDNAGDELEPAIEELKRTTHALLETTTKLKELSRAAGFDELDVPPPKYPDESLSLEIEQEGKAVGWTDADSSGFSRQVGESLSSSSGEVELGKDQIAAIFQKWRRAATPVAAGESPEDLRIGIHVRVPVAGVRLTYRRREGKSKITVRCVNDEKASFSQDYDDVVRMLSGEVHGTDVERSEASTPPASHVKPAVLQTGKLRNVAAAISDCVQLIQESNITTQRLLRAMELIECAGDPSADESVSY
jgi:hypothetical protein